jgi:uncharacterized protein DUF6178
VERRIKRVRPHQLVDQLLEHPELVQTVQALEPEALGKLIRHVGLEDCGSIVAWATTDQLAAVFDEDLWASDRPGEEETFDADRFATWLEVLLEAGAAFASERVADMDEELLVLALCRHLLVINQDELVARMSSSNRSDEDDLLDKELDSCLYLDLDEYQFISRNHRSWDAFMAILVELHGQHYDLFTRIVERCCDISHDYVEENGGLYEVLTSEEMLETDVAAEREERREKKGYVPPTAAASFLELARVTALSDICSASGHDVITRRHFQTVEPEQARSVVPERVSASVKALAEAVENLDLEDSETVAEAVAQGASAPRPGELVLTQAMKQLRTSSPELYEERSVELAFLVNVLMAGCSYRGRHFRAAEALEAVLATANLGCGVFIRTADTSAQRPGVADVCRVLSHENMVKLFRAGWNVLYRDVALYCGEQLRLMLEQRPGANGASAAKSVLAELDRQLRSGKPWLALGQLEDWCHEAGDATALDALSLIEECPRLPESVAEGGGMDKGSFIGTEAGVLSGRRVAGLLAKSPKRKRTRPARSARSGRPS